VRNANNELIATYEYNGLNRRIKKTVGKNTTKSFFNENWQELESQTNSDITTYVWGLRYIDDLVLHEKGKERLYSIADPNWNVVAIIDSTGNVKERYTYDAFGKRNVFDVNFTAKTETSFDWTGAFTGQVMDGETGLMLYRNRFYSVDLGRFVSRDPIEYEGGDNNLYRYVSNQSLNVTDIYGTEVTGYNHLQKYIFKQILKAIEKEDTVVLREMLNEGNLTQQQTQMVNEALQRLGNSQCKQQKKEECKPCVPPVGTVGYRIDRGHSHYPWGDPHTQYYRMNQSPPSTCRCFWVSVGGADGVTIPEGSVLMEPAIGGGAL
jgi:RHS repeat-associated protein